MTAFTVTTTQRIDELTSKAGGDTYAINGGKLIIDQDSRYGLNQTTSTSLGSITVSSTLGGQVEIDARAVRLIPYNSGSGNVPTLGTSITQSGVSGKLIGVWSAINVAPTASGSAMPASGFIKVKEVSGAYAAGALTGIGATATGADVAGWIEVVGDESATLTVPRLGSVAISGEWFEVGTTDGSSATTYQLPTSGSSHYYPGVFVETGTSTSVYEFYPSAGTLAGANYVGTDANRGKVCWITSAGVVRFGSDGTNTIGYVPTSGRKVVLPNVVLVNCATGTRTANATPNTTLGTRYDFTTTGGGAISIDKACCSWYPSFSKASSVSITNSGVNEQIYLSYMGGQTTLSTCGVGVTGTQAQAAIRAVACTSGTDITDFSAASSGANLLYCSDCADWTFTRVSTRLLNASGHNDYFERCSNLTFTDPLIVGISMAFTYCSDITINDVTYCGKIGSARTRATNVASFSNTGSNIVFDGLSFPDTDSFPTAPVVSVGYYNPANVRLLNWGSLASPLNFNGNSIRLLSCAPDPGADISLKRVWYANNTQYDLVSTNNNTRGLKIDNIYRTAGTGDGIYRLPAVDMRVRGSRVSTPDISPQSLAYGTLWSDFYTSDTAGFIVLSANEPSSNNVSLVTLTGTAKYTGAGGLVMPTVGDTATFEMDYTMLGHTGFSSTTSPAMADGTFTNYKYDFQYDTGSGWSAWSSEYTTATGLRDALAAISVTYTIGVKLKLRVTTTTGNTSAWSSIKLYTTTTAEAQQTLYPLGSTALTLTNVVVGSRVHIEKQSDGTAYYSGVASTSTVNITLTLGEGADNDIRIKVRKGSAAPKYIPFETLATLTADPLSVYVSQVPDTIAS